MTLSCGASIYFPRKGAYVLWIFVRILFENGKKMRINIAKRFRIVAWLNYLFWNRDENITHIQTLERADRQFDPY